MPKRDPSESEFAFPNPSDWLQAIAILFWAPLGLCILISILWWELTGESLANNSAMLFFFLPTTTLAFILFGLNVLWGPSLNRNAFK